MGVQVPAGLSGGQSMHVQTPTGRMAVQIPLGLHAGQSFKIQVPLLAQAAPSAAEHVQVQPSA